MNEDLELQLQHLQPGEPSVSLKRRLRDRLEPRPRSSPVAAWLLRLALPAAAGALVFVTLAAGRRGDSSEPAALTYEHVPTRASTSVYFPEGEPPVQVTRTSSQTYVAWHDTKSGQEIVRTYPCEQIVIAPLSIQ
jgi:hypothetical protein